MPRSELNNTNVKRLLFVLTFFIALTSCNNSDNVIKSSGQKDTIKTVVHQDTTQHLTEKLSFKSIAEILKYKSFCSWVNISKRDSSESCLLFFNLGVFGSDTLSVEYSTECWLYFPYKVEENKITVYWDILIDSKYDFEIVKTIDNNRQKYTHKPFMILELINDTTLKATYPFPELIKKLNSSDKDRTLFPDKYFASKKVI